MAHRKEEKENLRRQREEREAQARAAQQRKRLVGYGSAAALAIAAVVIILVLAGGGGEDGDGGIFPEGAQLAEQKEFDVAAAADAAGCELDSFKATGVATHTTSLEERVKYKQNPPTNGRHYEIPAEDGLYGGAAPQDETLVHSLEHGRVVVWAKPTLPQDARSGLRAIFDEAEGFHMLLVQRKNMPYAVAATAWNRDPTPGGTGRSLGCTEWSPEVADAIRAFHGRHASNGPEPVP